MPIDILMLTNEYPPHIYGGAGVHVDFLVRELARCDGGRHRLQVLCFGDQRQEGPPVGVTGVGPGRELAGAALRHPKVLDALYRNLVMAGYGGSADIVHCHTWYTFLAGCLIKQLLRIPLVVTTHSLEPSRPWKKEQLGNGYYAAGWLEETALHNADGIIAVSRAMKDDISQLYGVAAEKITVIHNGIDTEIFRPTRNAGIVESYGIDAGRPYVLFVGRETRQKGILHLVRALEFLEGKVQLVLCAGAADTPQLTREVDAVAAAACAGTGCEVIRIREMVPVERLAALYSHAAVFVCPSVYEPFGIINLEAMACGTPVVASAVGGIPEVVAHEKTGLLVPFEPAGPGDPEPEDPQRFSHDLAAAVERLIRSPEERRAMGEEARRQVEARYSWPRIARQTLETYARLTGR